MLRMCTGRREMYGQELEVGIECVVEEEGNQREKERLKIRKTSPPRYKRYRFKSS